MIIYFQLFQFLFVNFFLFHLFSIISSKIESLNLFVEKFRMIGFELIKCAFWATWLWLKFSFSYFRMV
jgi:hypothetical protein